ncbi:phosphatidylinositol N-acetylglucosaminyltransferase subunit P isoform X1 [Octopus vulgaris]|nr:phosphatidylinositol N-acetylglucosaminyltransferase subunit P [Octopus sinensis]XP_029643752.1 phosphatidylinositol N-acetylglucosaminyltransferase subunit P [Octopus sinensis]CAI9730880.1 phosphatidylinositol N-acetylglucosaminyltransferase subunit P isoform X1 [Octopus vulgaris]
MTKPEHTPFPSPERAIYGFALYLGSFICIVLYIGWAFIPDSYLHSAGLTYYPQKYWAVAIPAYIIMIVLLGYLAYFAFVFISTENLDSLNTITDKYALCKNEENIVENSIPNIYDLSVSEVTRKYYLNGESFN